MIINKKMKTACIYIYISIYTGKHIFSQETKYEEEICQAGTNKHYHR